MAKKIATIVLNRNLPDVTDSLCDQISASSSDITDLFVADAGSSIVKSKYTTWNVDSESVKKFGLRMLV